MVELLLLNNANIDVQDMIYLNLIILFLHKIIENKIKELNKKNKTPLHYAAEKNLKEIGYFLISRGADININAINYLTLIKLLFITVI